jgi:uncharacterized membrane protein SpoIIM required for sporulation
MTLRRLIVMNLAVLLSAVLCGAAIATLEGRRVRLDGGPAAVPVNLAGAAREIAGENARVWLAVCAGVASFGAVGTAVVATNGFRFGMDLTTVARSEPHELRFLLPHSVLEFAALTLAASACQSLAWRVFELLALNRRPQRVNAGVLALAVSACLVLAAAFLEAVSLAARLA